MTETQIKNRNGFISISPLIVFLVVYLLSSIVSGDFYKIPISASFLITTAYAFLVAGKSSIEEKVDAFSKGAGDRNILIMIWIYILAGAFSQIAVSIGAVESTVNLALKFISPKLLLAGLFFTSGFVSFAMGTSVGTCVTLLPMTVGIANETGYALPFLAAIIVGGAFFGDNLSFISDTTIAATRTQNISISDKVKDNLRVTGPATLIALALYVILGRNASYTITEVGDIELIKIFPYILVIVLSICRVNVMITLSLGILAGAVIGFASHSFMWGDFMATMGEGISSMGELIIITLLAGGLLSIIQKGGGLDYVVEKLQKVSKGEIGAKFSIAIMVSIAGICTANNTVAIITTGEIAKKITQKFGLNSVRTATLLDTYACIVQSVLPYSAQLLLTSSLLGLSTLEVIPFLYFPMILLVYATITIFIKQKKR